MSKEIEKRIRRAEGQLIHKQDQLNAALRDLPKRIAYAEAELKELKIRFKDGAYWIGYSRLKRVKEKIWVWENPYYA